MAKAKSGKTRKLFSPFLLSLAAMAAWAALHEPDSFGNPGMLGAWLLAALAVGLLVRAALALLAPLGTLGMESARLLVSNMNGPNRGGAGS